MIRRYLLIAFCCFAASLVWAADQREQDFLEGLHKRRLYRLATIHCQHLRATRPPADQAWIVAELVRSFGLWAADSPPEDASPRWAAAHTESERFRENHPDHPQRLLVLLQDAVVSTLEGRVAAESEPDSADEPAGRVAYRRAIRQLEQTRDLAEQQLREIRLARPDAQDALALAPGELERIRRQTEYELSRAFRLLALTYPPESADRVSGLLASIESLTQVIATPPTPQLAWVARVDRARCARLLGRRDEATNLLLEVLVPEAPPSVTLLAQAEQLRLAIQFDGVAAPPWPERRRGEVTSPEFDLALLEAMLAEWHLASGSQAAELSDRISRHVDLIGLEHGSWWLRRAKRAVGKQFATPGATATDDGLRLAAENLFLAGNYDEAVTAYDRAAKMAADQGKAATALELARSAAAVQLRRGAVTDARQRLLKIAAADGPDEVRAAAHHAAIVCTVMLARHESEPSRREEHLQQYRALLQAHVDAFPTATTTPTVWLWLGQLRLADGRCEDAIEAYRNVPPDHASFTVAVEKITDCFDAWLQQAANDKAARRAIIGQAATYFTPLWVAPRGIPQSAAWEAVAGWTRLAHPPRLAVRLPTAVTNWRNSKPRRIAPRGTCPRLALRPRGDPGRCGRSSRTTRRVGRFA